MFEAAPQRDRRFLEAANMLADEVQRLGSQLLTEPAAIRQLIRKGDVAVDYTPPRGFLSALGLRHDVFSLIFREDRRDGLEAVAHQARPFGIVFYMLPHVRWYALFRSAADGDAEALSALESFREVIDQWFVRRRNVVVHEIIHLFDAIRSGEITGSTAMTGREYYNHPAEFNAFTHELLLELFRDLPNYPTPVVESAVEDFETFKRLAFNTVVAHEFVPQLRKKNARKLVSRLWQHWDLFRSEIEDG